MVDTARACTKTGCLAGDDGHQAGCLAGDDGHQGDCPRCVLPSAHPGPCLAPPYQRPDGMWVYAKQGGLVHSTEESTPPADAAPSAVKRVPVDFNYLAINPDFLKALARIARYAEEKYGSWQQYAGARLEGEKSCINHIYEHLRCYQLGEAHDKFGDVKMHLAAIAYNAMMSWYYHEQFGHVIHPLKPSPFGPRATAAAPATEPTKRGVDKWR